MQVTISCSSEDLKKTRTTLIRTKGGKSFPCIADPKDRWNGWAMPYFTRKTVIEVLESEDATIHHKDGVIHFALPYDDPEDWESNEVNEVTFADGKVYYELSGWCFLLNEDF